MDPSVRSRVISNALRLGVHPFMDRIPGHAGSIRTARSTVDAASLLMRHTPRVRFHALQDPGVESGEPPSPANGSSPATPRPPPARSSTCTAAAT